MGIMSTPHTMEAQGKYGMIKPGGKHKDLSDKSKFVAKRKEDAAAEAARAKQSAAADKESAAAAKQAAKEHAAKMKARTVKSNATRTENKAKARVQALGYDDSHKETLGRGSYVGVENFLKNEASNQARADWRKKNRPKTTTPGKPSRKTATANVIPAPKAPAAPKNPNLSSKQS